MDLSARFSRLLVLLYVRYFPGILLDRAAGKWEEAKKRLFSSNQ